MSLELKGSEYLLKIEDPLNAGTFLEVGGVKSKSMTLNGEAVDVTNHGSNGWRQLLNGAGINSIDFSGEGVTRKVDTIKMMLESWKDKNFVNMRLESLLGADNVLTITVLSQIVTIELSGENDKEVPYSLSFQSAGEPTIDIF
jgi:TP901-1 family phage major tail protein